jgi:sialate O-acetylesterase
MRTLRHIATFCVLLTAGVATMASALELANCLTDNMVLQQNQPVSIWGQATPGDIVTVTFAGQTQQAKADQDGNWLVTLPPQNASAKGRPLMVSSGKDKLVLADVVIGDVVMFARQTFIDVSLKQTEDGREAIKHVKAPPRFRVLSIHTKPAKTPLDALADHATPGWKIVDRDVALDMSAAAFYLGRDLTAQSDVPLGIVDINMGHHFAISWLDTKALDDTLLLNPGHAKEITWMRESMTQALADRQSGKAQADLDAYYEQIKSKGAPKPSLGLHPLQNPMYPSAGFNAVIYPLRHLALRGVLLQLGNDYPFIAYQMLERNGTATDTVELNAAWGDNYMILKSGYRTTPATLPYVPDTWRRVFEHAELPFGLILPPGSDLDVYAAHNREIREMHRRTADQDENTGLIMPGTENVNQSGQPADERLLAQRCKQWLDATVFAKADVATGPLVDHVEPGLEKGTVYFKAGTADGLKASDAALALFETAGPDREFTPAQATLEGNTIKLQNEGPVLFVRYNWEKKPSQDLVNAAGLPAFPFNTDPKWEFGWIPPPEEANLPEEYLLTADKWSAGNVAIINGQIANMATGDSERIPRRPGPLDIVASPFGPNIYVVSLDPGSPATGILKPGDVIYGVNGKNFDDGPDVADDAQYHDLSAAITYSESEAGKGRLALNIRRGETLMEVVVPLDVMGSYSSTTPYYCEKSKAIVRNAEEWIASRYRPETGESTEPTGKLNSDLFFLLASGTPEYQGVVRRAIYSMIARMDPKPVTPGMSSKPWATGHDSMLLGEYFNATGDRNVLPYLKYQADLSAESQLKPQSETPPTKEAAQSNEQVGGWRHNYPGNPERWQSGYGLLPHAGMSCVMGMQLAKEAGLDIDELALARGIRHFNYKRGEYGFILYSYSNLRREGPPTMRPDLEQNGMLWSMNGKLGMAASLFNMLDGYNDSTDICARYCVYGYNNTRGGHGGMFFNNFWTPVGAWAAGEQAMKHFMKGQTWWRELFRRSDGSFNQAGRGSIGIAYALPYVAPQKGLRMLGAPRSAFGTNCPAYLKPAVDAHRQRDYARSEALVRDYIDNNVLPPDDVPVVDHFLAAVQRLRKSIAFDLDYIDTLIAEKKYAYAVNELAQLKGILPPNHERLVAIETRLASPEGQAGIAAHQTQCKDEQAAIKATLAAATPKPDKRKWTPVMAESHGSRPGDPWALKLVEHSSHAPENWMQPSFDDSDWNTTTLPTSWMMYHTALFRGTFSVDDASAVDGLRLRGQLFQQANVRIYLNGKLVAKIDEIGRGVGDTVAPLTDYGISLLKNGENTIAIASRHRRRWGAFRGTYKSASPMGFEIELSKTKK